MYFLSGYPFDCADFAGHNGCHVAQNKTTAITASCVSGDSYKMGTYSFPDTTSYYTSSKGDKSSSLVTTARVAKMFVSMVQVNYKATDLSSTASSTGPKPSSTNGATAGSSKGSSLSNGAVAGVAVGATLGGLALLAGMFFAIRRYRRNRLAPAKVEPSSDKTQYSTAEPYGGPLNHSPYAYYQVNHGEGVTQTGQVAHELPSSSPPVEMPANTLP